MEERSGSGLSTFTIRRGSEPRRNSVNATVRLSRGGKSPLVGSNGIASGSGSGTGSRSGSGSASGSASASRKHESKNAIGSFTKLSSRESSSPSDSFITSEGKMVPNNASSASASRYLSTSHFYRNEQSKLPNNEYDDLSVDNDDDDNLYDYDEDDEEAFLPVNFKTNQPPGAATANKWSSHASSSSFTDLSEASVSKSALEDALNDFSEDSSGSRLHH